MTLRNAQIGAACDAEPTDPGYAIRLRSRNVPCPALRPAERMRPGPLLTRANDDDMPHLKLARMSADYALMLAKRRAEKREPFTPAWDAAIGDIEDTERELFRLDQGVRATAKRPIG